MLRIKPRAPCVQGLALLQPRFPVPTPLQMGIPAVPHPPHPHPHPPPPLPQAPLQRRPGSRTLTPPTRRLPLGAHCPFPCCYHKARASPTVSFSERCSHTVTPQPLGPSPQAALLLPADSGWGDVVPCLWFLGPSLHLLLFTESVSPLTAPPPIPGRPAKCVQGHRTSGCVWMTVIHAGGDR